MKTKVRKKPAGRADSAELAPQDAPIRIKVLILPKFESGEMSGDVPGEAQYYYEAYCLGGKEYEIADGAQGRKLYVKDGTALYLTGLGKVNSALAVFALLRDRRFDFTGALILSTGCAGAAAGYGVMGDVYVISATVDADLGHCVDSRELADPAHSTTWFYDRIYESDACHILNPRLTAQVYDLVKDIKAETTDCTRRVMAGAFDGAGWAVRGPRVLRGTSVTSDNYWKGETGHANALLMTQTYGCPDPYAVTEMEDNAIASALERLGMLNQLVILRDAVNTDAFMGGATPESLWDPDFSSKVMTGSSEETADIFAVSMKNNFRVGRVIIEAALKGELSFL